MRARYHNISLHEDLIKEIDKYIQDSKRGFTSRAEVLSYAMRKVIDEWKKEKKWFIEKILFNL